MKIYKPKQPLMAGRCSATGNYDDVYLGFRSPQGPEDIPEGPVALSLRYKKRRKLVMGTIRSEPDSSPHFGLNWEYLFRPKNYCQREKLKKLVPGLFD